MTTPPEESRPTVDQRVTDSIVYGSIVQISNVSGDVFFPSTGQGTAAPPDGTPDRPTDSFELKLSQLLEPPGPAFIPRSPGFLLRADQEAVTFHGRESELQSLLQWCDGSGIDVRLIHGPGGQGKTRLAQQLAQLQRKHGWSAGFVATRADPSTIQHISSFPAPLLLIVDYAECRQTQVRALIKTALQNAEDRTVRILLLARSQGEWWTYLHDNDVILENALVGACAEALAPLEKQTDRAKVYMQAVHDLIRALSRIPTISGKIRSDLYDDIPLPEDLSDEKYENALTLQMNALLYLLDQGGDSSNNDDPIEVRLLRHGRGVLA